MNGKFIVEIIIAGLIFAGFHQFAEHSATIMTLFPDDLFAMLIVLGAIGLYLVRRFFRLSFGLIEVLIGIDAIWNVTETAPEVTDAVSRTQFLLQVAVAAYFIVRGLDNLDQSHVLKAWRKAGA